MGQLKLYVFGPPRMEQDGQEVKLQHHKDLALFIYLAVTHQAHHREALAALFWPESWAKESRASLRRALHRLRLAVGENTLTIDTDTVSLDTSAQLWVDSQAFQHLAEEPVSGETTNTPNLSNRIKALTEAAALYRGDFLAGFTLRDSPGFDEWQFFESESLRQLAGKVLEQLVELYEAEGQYDPAIQYARRRLSLDSLHEPAHRKLMVLYSQAGQQSAALRQYEALVQILKEQVGASPEAETVELYERIKARKLREPKPDESAPERGTAPAPARLPDFITSFIGREKEIEKIGELLEAPGCRLLTLLGPGGVGKTRLAVQAAAKLPERCSMLFPDGVYFVSLIAISSVEELVLELARAIHYSFDTGDQPSKQLLDALRPKHALFLLDNFEHLPQAESAGWITEVIITAPGIKFLATSRIRLNISGEQLFPIGGLETPDPYRAGSDPDPEEEVAAYSALRLFQQSASRVQFSFQLDRENLPAVAQICRLVQGMPLGIELAAAWVEVLAPEEIAAEIERSLDFLETDWRDLPERQRSLRAVFEASWKGLSSAEQEAIQALTVFRGGFTRQAAAQVSAVPVKMLMALANKSWVEQAWEGHYQLHELLRQYASELFQRDTTAWEKVREKHTAYFSDFIKQHGEAMKRSGQMQAFAAVAADYQNIRLAWLELVEAKKFGSLLEMLYGLAAFYRAGSQFGSRMELQNRYINRSWIRAMPIDLDSLFDTALKAAEEENTVPARLLSAAILTVRVRLSYWRIAIYDQIRQNIQRAWDLVEDLDPVDLSGFWTILLAEEFAKLVDPVRGIRKLRDHLEDARRRQDLWSQALALSSLGTLLKERDPDEAKQFLFQALGLYQDIGASAEGAFALHHLGDIAKKEQSYAESARLYEKAREVARTAGDKLSEADLLWDVGQAFLHLGEYEKAFCIFEEEREIARQNGWRYIEIFALSTISYEAVRYGDLEDAKQKRRECLAIAELVGQPEGIAWGRWEMGEIFRVEGDLETARQWYGEARELFMQYKIPVGLTFYYRGLGDIAQQLGDYDAAFSNFQESLSIAVQEKHPWCTTYALNGLGRAAVGLGDFNAARQYFSQALAAGRDQGVPGLIMVSLTGLASLCEAAGDAARAVQICAFVLDHYTSWRETKQQAAAILESAAAKLPEESVAAARKSGRASDWTTLAAELIQAE